MSNTLAWCITVAAVTLLVVLWHYVVWRELSVRRAELAQLARQAAFNRDTAAKAQNTPYEDGVKNNLEVSLTVYRKAAASYNAMRHRPLYRIPAAILGLSSASEEPERVS